MKNVRLRDFAKSDLSFVLVDDSGIVFKSKDRGLKPLVFCFHNYPKKMIGGQVFDKIVGRAAALIFSLAKVSKVVTPKITQEALDILRAKNIGVEFDETIEKVMNRDSTDLCPMEKMSSGKNAEQFWKLLIEKK